MVIHSTNSSQNKNTKNIYTRLLLERIIFINGAINDELANAVIAQLLLLEFDEPKKDIRIFINSPGGSVVAGLAIYDTIQFISPKISTICIGQACSMGALLLACGEKNKRFSLPNSRIMIHQPTGEFYGQASDIAIHTKEILDTKKKLNNILSQHTGQNLQKIEEDTERDTFMNVIEAKKYGIIDIIFEKRLN